MKYNLSKQGEPAFQPITLTITLESQKDLDFWGGLANWPAFSSLCRDFGVEDLDYRPFKQAGANINLQPYKMSKSIKEYLY